MSAKSTSGSILGIDLGPNSVGWALISTNSGKPNGITATGARVFQAGLDSLQQDGKGKSRNTDRREARGRRRLLDRHRRRMVKLANILMRSDLLSKCDYADPDERHETLKELDSKIGCPYQLRAKALDRKLTNVEFGRALYHLAQRRGFLSNRKSLPKGDEDVGIIKKSIGELQQAIDAACARTLGEYFSKSNPRIERFRTHYTSRQMYEKEFALIWEAQTRFIPTILTDELRKQVYKAIFYQRPLKSQSKFIGKCELERKKKRAPWALLSTQRFRYLQTVNNLRIIDLSTGEYRQLTDEEREQLCATLETQGDLTFGKIRKLLSFKSKVKFNLEEGGEKRIPGNRTAAKLIEVFGSVRWNDLSADQKNAIVEDMRSIVKDETLNRRGTSYWGLSEEQATKFSQISLEQGYCRFSRRAIDRLLPKLSEGMSVPTAIQELYPERHDKDAEPVELLPEVRSNALPELRNPIVERSLTELRKVVNAIIKKYGKPELVRIELARELRQPAASRERTWRQMRANEKKRIKAAEIIIKETGDDNPSRHDILKALLYEECNGVCPYTGKSISPSSLFGSHSQFDVEHIIPFERSLDDSFLNKTLCEARHNRDVKGQRTPYEAYHGTDDWDEITSRVKRFKGDASRAKLRRFLMAPEDVDALIGDFTSRQLNDTRWTAKWFKSYLGLLYGGINDDGVDHNGKRRVQATSGPATAFLRNSWELNGILNDGPGKSRDDHRHHAVDAIVIALTGPDVMKNLANLARRGSYSGRRKFDDLPHPWEGFLKNVEEQLGSIVVSHRVDKRVRGPLHKETFYGKPRIDKNGKTYVHSRKPISSLSAKDVENIVDPVIRDAIRRKLNESGQSAVVFFAKPENLPSWSAGNNDQIPIRHVRVHKNLETFAVGSGTGIRNVQSERNHHMEIVEVLDEEGNTVKWEAQVVSMFEAHRRLSRSQPIVTGDFGPGKRFLFSLAFGDTVEIEDEAGVPQLYVIRTVPQSKQVRFVRVCDARKLGEIPKTGMTGCPDTLRKRNCLKLSVSPLGEVRRARN